MSGTERQRSGNHHHHVPRGFPAKVIGPDDPRYVELVTGHNQRWVGCPEYVQMVSTTEQVVDAVNNAMCDGKRITVRSGGHCYENFVVNPDVDVVVDMSEMRQIYWDSYHHAFAVESGALLLDVYEELYKVYGVVIPAGYCYSVGSGGHFAGGGYGLLGRRNGLTVDHLYGVEVVTVDDGGWARTYVATRSPEDPHHDLWWAHTGGGGGNFGIVTRYLFRSPEAPADAEPADALPRPPEEVLLSTVSIPWNGLTEADFTRLVDNYGSWYETNSSPDSPYTALGSYLILNHRSAGAVTILTQVDASAPDAEGLLQTHLAELTACVDAAPDPLPAPRRLPWLRATRMLATSSPVLTNPTLRGDHKSACMRRAFEPTQVATLWRYLSGTEYDNPKANVVLNPYGGRIGTVADEDTAIPHRSMVFLLLLQAMWEDPAADEQHVAWTRSFYGELFGATGGVPVPNEKTDGCYVNYADRDISDPCHNISDVPWHALYYKGNYPRLRRVKGEYDPGNVFRHAQSIRPPA